MLTDDSQHKSSIAVSLNCINIRATLKQNLYHLLEVEKSNELSKEIRFLIIIRHTDKRTNEQTTQTNKQTNAQTKKQTNDEPEKN